nr:unnamed protein product [Callosobruchus analis]
MTGSTTLQKIDPSKLRKMLEKTNRDIQTSGGSWKLHNIFEFLEDPSFCLLCETAMPFAGIGIDIVEPHREILCALITVIFNSTLACNIWSKTCASQINLDLLNWTINVTSDSTKKIPKKVDSDPKAKPLKIIHLSDFHISTDYEIGSAAECMFVVCCKKGLEYLGYNGRTAGPWGDYDIDMVYFTGDIIDHTIWKSNKQENTQLIQDVFKALKETFPNTTVLPVLGNHEAAPTNTYAPPSIQKEQPAVSQEWLYNLVADLWKPWLNETSLTTVRKQGYYAHTFNSKLKIIALNNNFLEEQLYFLRNELEDSEANEQFVHIIAHQPTGNGDCGEPINVGYNGGSLTTFQNYNPNYKVMYLDINTYEILDIHTYTMNLTLANQNGDKSPEWYRLYSMKEDYHLKSFSPKELHGFVKGMLQNETLANMYWSSSEGIESDGKVMKSEIGVFILVCLASVRHNVEAQDDDSMSDEMFFASELAQLFRLSSPGAIEPRVIKKIISDLDLDSDIKKLIEPNQHETLCHVCRAAVKHLKNRKLTVQLLFEKLCNIYLIFATWTVSGFCEDIFNINAPILDYIINTSDIFDPELVCSILLQKKNCNFNHPALTWTTHIPPESTKKIPKKVSRDPNAKPLKIIHLTDFHISPDYEVGGVAACGYPVCCKKGVGNKAKGKEAGAWGDYRRCDAPPWLQVDVMMHINKTHPDIDMVYFTGDIVDHAVWKASQKENTRLLYDSFKVFYESFPNIPVLPLFGNHEPAPVNQYPPTGVDLQFGPKHYLSQQWLYDLASKIWSPWLPPSALKTVRKQGYYSYTYNSKLKIIALNNNVCYYLNWWLMYNTTYINEQLDFLRNEMEDSEAKGQFVHIIAHVPTVGQFYGHTHTDELKMFYDEKTKKAINVGYNGASLTTYEDYNPNYKLMYVDTNTYELLDIETYIMNMTHSNLHPNDPPYWYKLYSMKEAYGLRSLAPEDVDLLVKGLFLDDQLFNQYWR